MGHNWTGSCRAEQRANYELILYIYINKYLYIYIHTYIYMYIYAVIFNCISILDRFNPEWDPLSSKSEACGKASEWQKALHILSWSRRQSVIPGGAGDLGR